MQIKPKAQTKTIIQHIKPPRSQPQIYSIIKSSIKNKNIRIVIINIVMKALINPYKNLYIY